MANIDTQSNTGRKKWQQGKIDMTPMVDLGFLLISFFIFTAAITETKAMKLYMPHDGTGTTVSENNVLSFIVGEKGIFVYEGKWEQAAKNNKVLATNFSQSNGIGLQIRQKKLSVPADKKLTVLIHPLDDASYGDIVKILDEMLIYDVPSYAIVEPSSGQRDYFKRSH
jgi:biopolymer transport protein ExbD